MMNFKQLLLHVNARPFIDQARFGIEREGQRVDLAGNLAKTDHPAIFGDRSYHPYIQTDFSETQTEMITPVTDSIPELFQYLAAVYDVTARSMPKEEMIWPIKYATCLTGKRRRDHYCKIKKFRRCLVSTLFSKRIREAKTDGKRYPFQF